MYKYLFRFLPVVLALAFVSCNNNKLTEKVVTKFDNGQPSKVHYCDKDNVVVREAYFYEDGTLMMEGEMKDGAREGEWISYFPDGKVQSIGFYKDGVRTGKSKVYHENGNLWMDGYYKDNHQCGEWIYYDEQGYEIARPYYGDCD